MNILISRCLLGEPVRWHGKKLYLSTFVKKYRIANPTACFIPICPELLGGLSVPRPPVKRFKGQVFITCPEKQERKNITGANVTKYFIKGAVKSLHIAKSHNCHTAILCKWSPSCDKAGITGKLLAENGITVLNTF